MSEYETPVERGQRITEDIMEILVAATGMGAQEMVNKAAEVLKGYSQEELVIVCSYAMRYGVERAWDLRAALGRD